MHLCACAYTLIVQKTLRYSISNWYNENNTPYYQVTLIKTEVCNYSRSAQDNGASRRSTPHTDTDMEWPVDHKCSSVNQTAAAACLYRLSVDDWPAFRRITVSDKLWCVLIARIVVRVRPKEFQIKGKVAVHSHTNTHAHIDLLSLSHSPCCSRYLSILQTEQKNTLCFQLQRSWWGVTELGLNSL